MSVDSLGNALEKAFPVPITPLKIRDTIGSLIKAAVFFACVYGVVKWDPIELLEDDVNAFAEQACIDQIRDRYNASSVTVYEINPSNNGYVVRASIGLPRGKHAKGICLTNIHGGIKEITIEQR